MISTFWGKKIGMTQFFSANGKKVIPVTIIKFEKLIILQKKTLEIDGYEAIKVGNLRNKYKKENVFNSEWLKNLKKYFSFIKELKYSEKIPDVKIGDNFLVDKNFSEGEIFDATGKTIGKGFSGVVKRYNFSGGRASHGDKLGRKPGSLSGLRTQGMVFKGKKAPGRFGGTFKTVKNLKLIKQNLEESYIALSGAVPGKIGSFIMLTRIKNER